MRLQPVALGDRPVRPRTTPASLPPAVFAKALPSPPPLQRVAASLLSASPAPLENAIQPSDGEPPGNRSEAQRVEPPKDPRRRQRRAVRGRQRIRASVACNSALGPGPRAIEREARGPATPLALANAFPTLPSGSPTDFRRRPLTQASKSSSIVLSSEGSRSLTRPGDNELPMVSVVIPVFNEVFSIPLVVDAVGDVLSKAGWSHEIVVVDDGSTDGTTDILRCIAAEKPEVRAVVLNRNFGQSAAMMAGFDYAAGDIVVTLDGDMQNDPRDVPRLLNCLVFGDKGDTGGAAGSALEGASGSSGVPGGEGEGFSANGAATEGDGLPRSGGYDLVCGWRQDRQDAGLTRNLPSLIANGLIAQMTGVKLHDVGCCLRAYRADVVRSLRLYGELHRFLPALAAMEGASVCELPVAHRPRKAGTSKYGLLRTPRVLFDLALVLFLKSFRDRPMQFFGLLAAVPLLVSAGFLALFCSTALQTGPSYGWAMALSAGLPHLVATLEFFMASMLLMCLGLVADMCMRTYYESQGRAVYRVRDIAMRGVPT